jgi:hypothetical protein
LFPSPTKSVRTNFQLHWRIPVQVPHHAKETRFVILVSGHAYQVSNSNPRFFSWMEPTTFVLVQWSWKSVHVDFRDTLRCG